MLALLGFITIVTLLAAILTKKMSPLVALIAIPIIAALIGGGLETSGIIVVGITSIAPVAACRIRHSFFRHCHRCRLLDPIIPPSCIVGSRPTASCPAPHCWRC